MVIDASIFYELLILLININTDKSKTLADSLFDIYNENVSSLSSSDISYCNLYIALCQDIISQKLNVDDNRSDISNLIMRYLNNKQFRKDKWIHDALKELLDSKVTPMRLADISKKLNNLVMWYHSKNYIGRLYGQLKECDLVYAVDDQTEKLEGLKSLVDEFKTTIIEIESTVGKGGAVEVIDFSKKDSIREAYDLYQERQVTHVLKTGLQGLNKMCGKRGGFALGESVIFCSLMHNFKSGILMKMAQWIAAYSTPPKHDHKKPLILFVTLENIGFMNMMDMFRQMYFHINQSEPPADMNDATIVDNIYEYFNRSDYTLIIERYLPSTFGYDELVRLIEKYESSGFKVVATIVDYLSQMKAYSGSVSKSGDHVMIQELFNKVCNYFKAIGTTLFSAAQLNRGASDVVATGIPHPVKHFSERHLAGSMGIGREVDFMAYMHIERDEHGNSWLTLNWGKHRYVNDTPEKDKFVAYKFEPYGLPDDINGKFAGVRNIYTATESSKATQQDIESILGIGS